MEARENKTDTQSEKSNNDSSRNENTPARLRRLKIQQNILQKGIKHVYSKLLEDVTSVGNKMICSVDDNTYFDRIKKMFTEIKHLYEEIRFLTDETNKGKSSDIDEIRKNILLLETKIKEYKKYLQFELETLRKEEMALNEHRIVSKKVTTVSSAMPSKYIAPSPVKVLIESPFKCLEVQQFHEFMKHTKRYGGWNEYDHNKFIQIWNTYCSCAGLDYPQDINVNNSETCLKLVDELVNKIEGLNREDIISHVEWYKQYLQLYTCQKNALNKWKDNRNKIKKYNKATHKKEGMVKSTDHNMKSKNDNRTRRTSSKCSNDSLFSDLSATSEKSYDDLEVEEQIQKITTPYKSKLMEPTKQWLYRCNDQNDTRAICDIETVQKLSVPSWRVSLQY